MAKRITRERFMKWARHEFCPSGRRWMSCGNFTPKQAWEKCQRPAWMLYALHCIGIDWMYGPAHEAAKTAGWTGNYFDYDVNRPACSAIRRVISWHRIAERLEKVIA
jgi:hypothetical protein